MAIGTPVIGAISAGASGNVTAPGLPAGISGRGVLLQIVDSDVAPTWTDPTNWTRIALLANGTSCASYVIGREYADAATAATTAITRGGTTGAFIARAVWVPGATLSNFIVGSGSSSATANITFGAGLNSVQPGAIVFATATKSDDFSNVGTAQGTDTTVCSPMGTHSGLTWTELYEHATSAGADVGGVTDYSINGGSVTNVGTTGSITSAGAVAQVAYYFSLREAQVLTPGGIASAEAWGTTTLQPGAVSVSPGSVGSAEAFGSATVSIETQGVTQASYTATEDVAGTQTGPAWSITPSGSNAPSIVWAVEVATVFTPLSLSPSSIGSGEAWGSHRVDHVAAVSGISSAEAWGSASVQVGAVSVAPPSIASDEAWGSHSLTVGAVSVSPSSVASAEAFGSATVQVAAVSLAPGAIASTEAWGSTTLSVGAVSVSPGSIASAESWGQPAIGQTLASSSIASGEAWGSAVVTPTNDVAPSSIATAEAWGSPSVVQDIASSSIASAEVWGQPTLATAGATQASYTATSAGSGSQTGPDWSITPDGPNAPSIVWSVTVASTVSTTSVEPSSIGSGEAFGSPSVGTVAAPSGIPSAEAWGTARIDQEAVSQGIPSAEAFGSPSVGSGAVSLSPSSIGSAEAFGTPSLSIISNGVTQASYTSQRGSAGAQTGPNWSITPDGSNAPSVVWSVSLLTVTPPVLNVSPGSIGSGEAWGTPSVAITGPQTLTVSSIGSGEAWGLAGVFEDFFATLPLLYNWYVPTDATNLSVSSIGSGEAFGTPSVQAGAAQVLPSGITSAEAFGSAALGLVAAVIGIPSSEAWGSPAIQRGAVSVVPASVPSSEAWGGAFVYIPGLLPSPYTNPPTIATLRARSSEATLEARVSAASLFDATTAAAIVAGESSASLVERITAGILIGGATSATIEDVNSDAEISDPATAAELST